MGVWFWSRVEEASHLNRLFSNILEIADYVLRLPSLQLDNTEYGANSHSL